MDYFMACIVVVGWNKFELRNLNIEIRLYYWQSNDFSLHLHFCFFAFGKPENIFFIDRERFTVIAFANFLNGRNVEIGKILLDTIYVFYKIFHPSQNKIRM